MYHISGVPKEDHLNNDTEFYKDQIPEVPEEVSLEPLKAREVFNKCSEIDCPENRKQNDALLLSFVGEKTPPTMNIVFIMLLQLLFSGTFSIGISQICLKTWRQMMLPMTKRSTNSELSLHQLLILFK